MKTAPRTLTLTALFAVVLAPLATQAAAAPAAATAGPRVVQNFDAGWRFLKSDADNAQQPAFNDAEWRALDVPHDWSIEGPYSQNAPTRGSGGWLPAGVGWYRKTFTLPADWSGKRIYIEFDGVMANSDVWINGQHLGRRPYGYVGFRYDLTGHLKFGAGESNVLAVRADNAPQPASRWYTGAGIYRHVKLVAVNPLHIEHWGVFAYTPKVSAAEATVHVQTWVVNNSDAPQTVSLSTTLLGPAGQPAAPAAATETKTLAPGSSVNFEQDIAVANPKLWDIAAGNLYQAAVRLNAGGTVADNSTVTFGIRDAQFSSEQGFLLNGRKVPLYGVCLHHDGGMVGAAVPTAVWEHRLNELRQLGVNAIRTAHNPPSTEFLDLCDRMGFVVMDELFDCWQVGKSPQDYSRYFDEWSGRDVRDTVLRDRNHPSVILWSSGNEIHDTPNPARAIPILERLVATFHQFDPTRPVTQGLFRPNVSGDYNNGLADLLDVIGTNYRDEELLDAWKDKPTRKIIGTEQRHEYATWVWLRDYPQHSGQFIWSGMDYLGEALGWPNNTARYGLFDRAGGLKLEGMQRAAWWSPAPVLYLLRTDTPPPARGAAPGRRGGGPRQVDNWTPRGETAGDATVQVFSNADEVELFLNGNSLGAKPVPGGAKLAASRAGEQPEVVQGLVRWQAPYADGTLKAVARKNGEIVAERELTTAGPPAKIVLTAQKSKIAPEFNDAAYVTATLVDANGVRNPWANNALTFTVSGPGVLAAVDNGDNTSTESYQGPQRSAFEGRAYAIVKANAPTGAITLMATAEGLPPATLTLDAVPPAPAH